jgi:hypothetical protein
VAVPDLESIQFRILGKRWDVISPMAHFQYFNERSLTRLVERCGFQSAARIALPLGPEEAASRWLQLVRQLGGTDAGEITLTARNPG